MDILGFCQISTRIMTNVFYDVTSLLTYCRTLYVQAVNVHYRQFMTLCLLQ